MARRRRPEQSEVELGRVITPMLDMAFQILFFFVVMYQPSAMEGQMEMALPAAGEGVAPKDAKPTMSAPEDIELPAELEVIVRTAGAAEITASEDLKKVVDRGPEGTIGRIIVKNSASQEKQLGGQNELKAYLEKVRPTLNNRNDIKLQADGRLKYAYVIQVMDTCRRAGFNNVAFAPPPDLARITPGVP